MAKKFNYKKLQINKEELQTTTIGEISTQDKSPIFMFILFGMFLAFVFFLPNIVTYFQGKSDDLVSGAPKNNIENNKTKDDNTQVNNIVYYDINSNENITLEDILIVSNLKKSTNNISFKVTNKGESRFYFSKYNYFLELYTSDNTLLERIFLDKDSIVKDSSKDYSYDIKNNTSLSASKIAFVKHQIEDYPNIVLTKNNEEEQVLTCKNKNEVLTYTFKDEKLVTVNDMITYIKDSSELDYQTNLVLWQGKVLNYNSLNGVTSTILNSIDSFVANTTLDLKNVDKSNIDNNYYYEYETLAKIVNFEMESRGFNCE